MPNQIAVILGIVVEFIASIAGRTTERKNQLASIAMTDPITVGESGIPNIIDADFVIDALYRLHRFPDGVELLGRLSPRSIEHLRAGGELRLPDGELVRRYIDPARWGRRRLHGVSGGIIERVDLFARNQWFRETEGSVFARSKTQARDLFAIAPDRPI